MPPSSSATSKGGFSSLQERLGGGGGGGGKGGGGEGGGSGSCGPVALRSSALPPVAAPSGRSWSCAVIKLPKLLIPCPDLPEAHAEPHCHQPAAAAQEEGQPPNPTPIRPCAAGGTKGVFQRQHLDHKVSASAEDGVMPCDSWKEEGEYGYESEEESSSSREYVYTSTEESEEEEASREDSEEEEADGKKQLNPSLTSEHCRARAHAVPLSHSSGSTTAPSSMALRSFSAHAALSLAAGDTTFRREFRRNASVPSVRAAEHSGAYSGHSLGVASQRNFHRTSSISPRLLNAFSPSWAADATAWDRTREHVMANWNPGKPSFANTAVSKKKHSFSAQRKKETQSFAVGQGMEEREKKRGGERLPARGLVIGPALKKGNLCAQDPLVVHRGYAKPPPLVVGCDDVDDEEYEVPARD